MADLGKLQKEILQNKVDKGFNTTDINLEFCFLQKELAEAFQAYHQKLPDLGEELADAGIYLLGLAEILGIDLEKEISEKMEKNKGRRYKKVNGANIRVNPEKEQAPRSNKLFAGQSSLGARDD